MKRIGLFLGSRPNVGGTFQYAQAVLSAVAALPAHEFQTRVAYAWDDWLPYIKNYELPSTKIEKTLVDRLLPEAWSRLGLPLSGWRRLAPSIHPASKKFLEQSQDIWIFPSQDSWAFWIPVNALGTIHDLMHRYQPQFPEVSERGEYRRREQHYKRTCRWTQGILVDSDMGKTHVCESYDVDPSRVHVLPFTPPEYIYSERTPQDFSEKYHLPNKYLFYPAQFWLHKNHLRLIAALKQASISVPDIKLVLVGSKNNGYASAVELVDHLDLKEAVTFYDYVADDYLPTFYERARAMVMPTYFGPTNIPPIEALVKRCPVAVSNIYGMPEQLGDAAIYFDPDSETEIAEAITRLWVDDNLCALLRERGSKRAIGLGRENFTQRLSTILALVNDTKSSHPVQTGI